MFYISLLNNSDKLTDYQDIISKIYDKYYNTHPNEFLDYIIIAEKQKNNNIIGTVSIEYNRPLEVEQYFKLNREIIKIIEQGAIGLGRYVSVNPNVTISLLYSALLLAKYLGFKYFFSFQPTHISDIFTKKYKIPLNFIIPKIKKQTIQKYKNYFLKYKVLISYQKIDIVLKSIEINNSKYLSEAIINIPNNPIEIEKYHIKNITNGTIPISSGNTKI